MENGEDGTSIDRHGFTNRRARSFEVLPSNRPKFLFKLVVAWVVIFIALTIYGRSINAQKMLAANETVSRTTGERAAGISYAKEGIQH
jgi:hypothetical protein